MKETKDPSSIYDFLGYRLLKADYTRRSFKGLEYFQIKTLNPKYDNSIYSFQILVIIKYDGSAESSLLFDAGFDIKDVKWKESVGDDSKLMAVLFSIVFPFIRVKIQQITDDSRESIAIPVIDLRFVDMTKGVTFSRKPKLFR